MSIDFNEVNQTLFETIANKVDELKTHGVTWLRFDSNPSGVKHVRERHFGGGDVTGSKFLSDLSDEQVKNIIGTGELAVVSGLLEKINGGAAVEPSMRVEAEKDFSDTVGSIGTDVLIKRKEHEGGVVSHRNPSNEYDSPVYLIQAKEADMPLTSKAIFVGGTYRPEEGKTGLTAGFYTFFPGQNAPPMSDAKFWDKHGFLATSKELVVLVDKLSKYPELKNEKSAVQDMIIRTGSNRPIKVKSIKEAFKFKK